MANSVEHHVPNSAGTAAPALRAPPNAADCHIHIYDPRFQPVVTNPSNSTVAHYRLLQKRIGVSRVVIVQPRNYRTDNSATLDAIKQLGIANARGVGVLHPDVPEDELKRLDERRAWVKISGAYINTRVGPPTYSDASAVAQAFVKASPGRLVWGSDWPHPSPTAFPDDAVLFDLLSVWAPDEAVRKRILVDNPKALYGF